MLRTENLILNRCEEWLMVISMALITILISIQVVLRYGFGSSIPWAEEVTRFIVIWMTFIGAAMGVRLGANISIDILVEFLPKRFHWPLLATAALCGTLFGVALIVFGYPIVTKTASIGQVSSALRIPMAWVYLIFVVGGALLTLRFAQQFVGVIRGGPLEPEGDDLTRTLPGA